MPRGGRAATTPGPGAALFRFGESAWGSQSHLELTEPMLIEGWTVDPDDVSRGTRSPGGWVSTYRQAPIATDISCC